MRQFLTLTLTFCTVVSPCLASSGEGPVRTAAPVELKNVSLNSEGELKGRLLKSDGKAKAGVEIKVHSATDINQVAQVVKTDKQGRFVVKGLKKGTCVLSAGEETYAFRVWPERVAPPKSLKNVALVVAGSEVRGQDGRESIWGLTPGQKVLCGLAIAAAIAIPVAVHNGSDDDAS